MNLRENILSAFLFRHACKVFDAERRIDAADFEVILEAGRLSPSSFGQEPWQFLVVQNPELRNKLKAHAWGGQGQLPSASHVVLVLARTGADMRFDSAYIDYHLKEVEQLAPEIVERKRGVLANFQQNGFRLLESERALFDWAGKQCYIPLANMMTAAALLGIDSCPMEGFDPQGIEAVLAEHCAVDPARLRLAVMVAFGYRVNDQPAKRRQTSEQIVRWYD